MSRLAASSAELAALLSSQRAFAPLLPFDLDSPNVVVFDFTERNARLRPEDVGDVARFSRHVFDALAAAGSPVGIGRYDEDRVIYRWSSLFSGEEPRTVHLGIDLWAAPGTAVLAPLAGTVHSFANNPAAGDYGPTIVLEHVLQGVRFCTLYGHLSLSSLHGLGKGTAFLAGQRMATIGRPPTNGNWPPHLHFQVIRDMLGKSGDFYGVAPLSRRAELLDLCPDPNRILRIAKLRSERR